MLDFTQLGSQMQGFSQALAQEAVASRKRLDRATTLLEEAIVSQEKWVTLQHQWGDRLGFTLAEPLEPLNTVKSVISPDSSIPAQYTVLATDGSQIAPSHHEIAFCYLLNTGRVALHYGQGRYPLLDSVPEVFYHAQDLYECRQWGISTEEWMGYRRTISEAEVLAQLAQQVHPPLPALLTGVEERFPPVALVDGSLIYWFLDGLPSAARDRLLPPILAAWQQLQAINVPLMGYLSASRSGETLNFLRLLRCPYEAPDCDRYCAGQTDKAPCQVLAPLKDATFWETRLQPGDRGPIWKSHARILSLYGDQTIYFCHLHVGSELARIEFPAWVVSDFQDLSLLHQLLGLVMAQVQKGYGYPIALAEAHNQAVVRGSDRRRFFALLEQEMIKAGLKNVGTSYKETRKRESIA
ncbi:MAG: DNA double-strand break repair nuclease NurA [Prochlorotrichaceae cyanobacterium]|jgi:hypothetical protein